DRTVRTWDAVSGDQLNKFPQSTQVQSVACSPTGGWIATGGLDGTIRISTVESGMSGTRFLSGHQDQVNGLAFDPTGQCLASASHDHTVKIWNVSKGQPIHTIRAHADLVAGVMFDPDGRRLVSASTDCTVKILDPWMPPDHLPLRNESYGF